MLFFVHLRVKIADYHFHVIGGDGVDRSFKLVVERLSPVIEGTTKTKMIAQERNPQNQSYDTFSHVM